MYRLVVELGPHSGESFTIQPGRSLIGRGGDASFSLGKDPTVSRAHLELIAQNSLLAVSDLSSTSGSFVNGRKLMPGNQVSLSAGDQVSIGNSRFKIHLEQSAQAVPPPRPVSQNHCRLCSSNFTLFGGKAKSHSLPGYCNDCSGEIKKKLERFKSSLQSQLVFWNGQPKELDKTILDLCQTAQVDRALALQHVKELTIPFLQKILSFMLADAILTEDEEQQFSLFRSVLSIGDIEIPHLVQQIRHYSLRRNLSQGNIPTLQPSIITPPDEVAHFEAPATYVRELASGVRYHSGLLILTNSRIVFTNSDLNFEASLGKVSGTRLHPPRHMELHLTRRQGSGLYESSDASYLVEVLKAVLERHHRKSLVQQSGTRIIPQNIKSAVWARDGGKCVERGDSQYLEFDHIIPFSKGGASSLNNLQLLCRRCNLSKGARL